MKNYSITIETGEHAGETVWVHRSIAVAGFIFCRINNEWCVLANQRGEGAPDFQGYWNCPCGYLDFDETLAEACSREIYEETGVNIEPSNHRHLIEGIFYTYVDYEEVEGLDDLFAE